MASRESLTRTAIEEALDEMDPATKAVIRRRSFAQPGVATRHAKPEMTIKRKSVPAPAARPQVWKKEMMGASPLARLSSLDDLQPPPVIQEHRSNTPSDLEYSQLGNLKHGSLMVINGPPSPVPSVAAPGSICRKGSDDRDEDFFTASESGSVDDSPASRRSRDNLWGASHEGTEAARQARTRARGGNDGFAVRQRDGSPLKQELHIEPQETRRETDAESVYSRHLRPAQSAVSLLSQEVRSSLEDQKAGAERRGDRNRAIDPNQSAVSLASEYMSEMPTSPYKRSPVQQGRTSVSPLDEGFDELTPSDIRKQMIELPPSIGRDPAPISPRKPLRSHPTLEMIPKSKTATSRRSIGVKTDSGYSSSASASIVGSMSPLEMHQPNLSTVESLADNPPQQRFYASKAAVDIAIRIGHIHPQRSSPDTEVGADSVIIESIEKDPSKEEKVKRSKSWRKSVRKSLPRLLSSETTVTASSRATSEGASSTNERKPNKLQKRRPLSQPPINMADRHILDKTIPRIPSKVFSRYSGRLSASPGMQHLEETYLHAIDVRDDSMSPTASKPSLPSCFFPDAEEAPAPPAHRLSFARRNFRRSRTQIDEHEILFTGIADFGTVSESLGTSPYDAAISAPRRPYSGSATQPHHLSTRASRAGPREGWDAETASKFAQMRSRVRAAQRNAWQEQKPERRSMPPRPVSHHEDMRAYPPSSESTVPRPQSMHAHSMPFPASRPEQMPVQNHLPISPPTPQHRPKTSHERDPSPVKSLVNVFEQRASHTPAAPPPRPAPVPQQQPDWSDSSRLWRERRLNAQTSVVTSSSSAQQGRSMTTTTTTVTTYDATAPARPVMQHRKSMPPTTAVATTAAAATYGDEGMFGRYGGGHGQYTQNQSYAPGYSAKKDVTPSSGAAKRLYGIDFGDVPFRVI
jgi:hypothetical protein